MCPEKRVSIRQDVMWPSRFGVASRGIGGASAGGPSVACRRHSLAYPHYARSHQQVIGPPFIFTFKFKFTGAVFELTDQH